MVRVAWGRTGGEEGRLDYPQDAVSNLQVAGAKVSALPLGKTHNC